MLPNVGPTPGQIVGELLGSHPEAESLLAEARHRRALAANSAAESGEKFAAAQASRLGYETLRRLLEPRRTRLIHLDIGLLLLTAPAVGIVLISLYELSGLDDGAGGRTAVALAASAVWLALAWLAATAARRGVRSSMLAIAGAVVGLGALETAVHALAPGRGQVSGCGAVVSGAFAAVLIFGLTVGAGVVIHRLEPASLLIARRRWHRARSEYAATERTRAADAESAVIASEAWLELIRVKATKSSGGDELLVEGAGALAAGLLDGGRPELWSG